MIVKKGYILDIEILEICKQEISKKTFSKKNSPKELKHNILNATT